MQQKEKKGKEKKKNSFTETLQFKGECLALQSDFFEYKGHLQYRL